MTNPGLKFQQSFWWLDPDVPDEMLSNRDRYERDDLVAEWRFATSDRRRTEFCNRDET